MNLLTTSSFGSTFGPKRTRKRPKVSGNASSLAALLSNASKTQDSYEAVSSPPRLLSNDALKKKKLEVLSRVKLNCMKQKHDLMTKRKMKLALKLKQQAWVETNLQIKTSL